MPITAVVNAAQNGPCRRFVANLRLGQLRCASFDTFGIITRCLVN
jgi:hypothetical protein